MTTVLFFIKEIILSFLILLKLNQQSQIRRLFPFIFTYQCSCKLHQQHFEYICWGGDECLT